LISEIYFNPPSSPDTTLEYIELMGDAGFSLDDHYLIFLENENDEFNSQNPGQIENIFDLNGMTFGSNGYLVLGQKNTLFPAISGAYDVLAPVNPAAPTIAESLKTLPSGAHAYVNRDTGTGYGIGVTSSIQHVGQNNEIEGSGFTAMLIHVDTAAGGVAPVFNFDLDLDNDGLDIATGRPNWNILDSIGVFGEVGEALYGRLYAQFNFGPGIADPLSDVGGVEPGAVYIDTEVGLAEIEYVGRVNKGNTAESWVVTNLTNNTASGYSNSLRNYGVSGDHDNFTNPEVYVGSQRGASPFVYGTDITVTLGTPNVAFIPEPSSWVLLTLGGAAAVVARVRRRRQVSNRRS
jgi:hypothetical protein